MKETSRKPTFLFNSKAPTSIKRRKGKAKAKINSWNQKGTTGAASECIVTTPKQKPYVQKFTKPEYERYLNSATWKKKKKALQKRYEAKNIPWICLYCTSKKNLQVHHRTYRRLKRERMSDLVCICTPCHNKLHRIQGEFRISVLRATIQYETKMKFNWFGYDRALKIK